MAATNDSDVYYKDKKDKPGTSSTAPPYYDSGSNGSYQKLAQEIKEIKPISEQEIKDIEEQIRKTREEKMQAAEYHDITILRQKAAEHSADAAKLFKKYRKEESVMVKNTENASKMRRKAEGRMAKSKELLAKADQMLTGLNLLPVPKQEKTKIKIAKLKEKAAKCMSKAHNFLARGAKLTAKAAARRQRAKANLEKSKLNESEALAYNKRADTFEKIHNDGVRKTN